MSDETEFSLSDAKRRLSNNQKVIVTFRCGKCRKAMDVSTGLDRSEEPLLNTFDYVFTIDPCSCLDLAQPS